MLEIISPLPFVLGAIYVSIYPVAIRFVFLPFSLENIPVNMVEFPVAESLIVLPLPLILCSIRPLLYSEPIPHVSDPFSFVDRTAFEFVGRPLFSELAILAVDFLALVLVIKVLLVSTAAWLLIEVRFVCFCFGHIFPRFVAPPAPLDFNGSLILP